MRKTFWGLLAAFVALGACGAIPDTAEGWYTPPDGFNPASGSGKVVWNDSEGHPQTTTVTVNAEGGIEAGSLSFSDPTLQTAYNALVIACNERAYNIRQDNKIETIGKNLYDLTQKTGVEVENNNTGQKFTIKFNGSIASAARSDNGNIHATSDAKDPADKKTLNWTDNTDSAKLQIFGANTAAQSADEWWDDYGFLVPSIKGAGSIAWKRYGGYDPWVFAAANTQGGERLLTLKEFHADKGCDEKLSELLTEDDSTQRNMHYIVCRYGNGGGATLHYLPIGNRIGGGAPVDEKSVTTNVTNGAFADGVASLYGWTDEAKDGAETLTQMLSDGSSEGRGTHYVLARVGTGENAVLGYVPIGEGLDGVTWATNWTEAIKGIAVGEAEKVVNWNTNWVRLADNIASSHEAMKEYVDNTLNWTTNWYASTQEMNASVDGVRKYIDGQLDIITNQIAGIDGVIASGNTKIQTVNQYIQTVMDIQTNFITNAEFAQLNGTVASTKEFVDETFNLLTNQIVGIKGVIESGDVQTVNTVAEYIQEVINLQTNFITDAQFAQLNGTVESTKELVDYYFDILTNQIVGIKGVIESGDFTDLQTVGDYVQKEIGIQTNEMVAIMTALDNGVAESVTELVEYKYDILTNEIAGIKGVIESDVVTVDSLGDYIKKVINIQTNVIVHEAFVTNFINTFEMVENWTYVTNYIVRYLGVTDSGGGHGGEEEGPTIAPEDDPYSGEYEPQDIDDFLLPVKNARNIVSITNEPLSEIESTHLLDFVSVDTNKDFLVQLRGFDEAEEESIPIKRRGDDEGEYRLEWMSSPVTLFEITTNGIAEIKNWLTANNINNIFTTVVTNSETINMMRTNMFAHVQPSWHLDNETIWTNGSRKVEIKGYEEASKFTVPFIDYNSEIVMEGKEKGLVWAPLPFADSDANERTGNASIPRTIEANLQPSVTEGGDEIKALSLYGFSTATEGQVPMKLSSAEPGGAESIMWVDMPGATALVGTDDISVVIGGGATTNTIAFLPDVNSNVTVTVTRDAQDERKVNVTIGVRWK